MDSFFSRDHGAAFARIRRSLAATATAPLATALFQAAAVPVFLRSWGAERYGVWLLLAALPAWMNFADLGLGAVAGSEMTMRVAGDDRHAASEIFQSAWLASAIFCGIAGAAAAAAVVMLPLHVLTGTAIAVMEARLTLLALAGCALLNVQGGILAAGLRCEGNYAAGTMAAGIGRLVEVVALLGTLIAGGVPAIAATSMLACRAVTVGFLWELLRRRSPWLHFGFAGARRDCLRRLLRPSLAYLGFPAANAIGGEGMSLALGATLGPVPLVAFSTMRTLARAGFQLTDVVKNSVWPELSAAFGGGDRELACRIHRRACQWSMALACGAALALATGGERLFRAWTRGSVVFDAGVFALLLAALVVNAAWYTSSAAIVACNRHARLALAQVVVAAVAAGATAILAPRFGMTAGAATLLAGEAILAGVVLPASLELVGDSLRSFAGSLFNFRMAWSRL